MKRGGGYSTYVNGNFMHVQDLDTICDNLKELFDSQERENSRLRANLQEMTDNAWKDTQLQKMRSELELAHAELNRGFKITEKQAEKISNWQKEHEATQHDAVTLEDRLARGGAAGGSFSYKFLPTGIGTFGSCVCGSCKSRAFREAKGDTKLYQKLLKDYDAEFEFQKAW